MMARFLMSLREPNTALIIVGFGFNDVHLNSPVISAVQSNPSLSVVVVDPSLENKITNGIDYPAHLKLANYTSSRVTFLNATFGQFTNLIPDLKGLGWDNETES